MTSPPSPLVSFSHVHLYVDKLQDLSVYKKFEEDLNEFSRQCEPELSMQAKQDLWSSIIAGKEKTAVEEKEGETFTAHKRDVVLQLMAAFGFRVTGARFAKNTRSILVTSKDARGVQVVITAVDPCRKDPDPTHHFNATRLQTFYKAHNQRQGIAVLGFWVNNIETIRERYQSLHPNLVSHFQAYPHQSNGDGADIDELKILEVFAFYQKHGEGGRRETLQADQGTVLRFSQKPRDGNNVMPLPGLFPQEAEFDDSSFPAYSDHWVSNVFSRTEFLDTLNETLDFSPKVDFNAGVVAAGEAQIESTVTGNESNLSTNDKEAALRDMSQVYLPINNALSDFGHVSIFLKQIGQGVQHVASRVQNLVGFVQRANEQRIITNEGFTFLNIPRSYYGVLTLEDLNKVVSKDCGEELWRVLDQERLLAHDGAVNLDVSKEKLDALFCRELGDSLIEEFNNKKEAVLDIVLKSRYKNLHSLLRDHVSEVKYVGIVRNQILVDIQGEDLLYQIFTCKILHREAIEEAPFFEFIERVCSECMDENGCPQKIRPGCGGFGIRNFLTLFLSIEVTKAMYAAAKAKAEGDTVKQEYEQTRVDYFTAQLNESNPILTEISDAMTDEGRLTVELERLSLTEGTVELQHSLRIQLQNAGDRKRRGNAKLMETSAKYNHLMSALRKDQQL